MLLDQLVSENKTLRDVLRIQNDAGTIDEIEKALRHQEMISEEVEIEKENIKRQEVEVLKREIELQLREEYEFRWEELLANAQNRKDQFVVDDADHVQADLQQQERDHHGSEDDEVDYDEENHMMDEDSREEPAALDGGGDSVGSSGNFAQLFEGQTLSAEEYALLSELKQREREEKFKIRRNTADDDINERIMEDAML